VEGREADARSDIWALGAVIYEAVTGKRAFEGNTPASVIGSILKDNPPLLSRVQPLAPPLLDRIVMRCLEKDADDRWQSVRDLRTALGWTGDQTHAESRSTRSPVRWAVTAVALLAAGGAVGWFGASSRAPVTSPRALSLEIGPPAGGEIALSVLGGGSAISPDGTAVAFVAKVEGVSRLWVRRLDSIASQELPDTDDAQFPFWSPDGRSLAYFARGSLRRVEALGGASAILTSVVEPRGGSWGTDGTIVFGEGVGPLQRISASGGTRSSLTRLAEDDVSHRWPRFLPDGRTLLFFAQGDRPGAYLTALDRGGEKERVADASADAAFVPPRGGGPGYVVMIQGDSLVAQPFDLASRRATGPAAAIPGAGSAKTFTGTNRSNLSVANDGTIVYASGSNRYQMTWFDAGGAPVGAVGTPDRYVGLRISPDGSQVLTFVDDAVGNRDIWRVDSTTGARTRVTADNRGAFGTWFPDSRRIAFSGQSRQTLFEKSVIGDPGERALLRADYPVFPTDSSPDGKYLLYATQQPGYDLMAWVTGAESKPVPIAASPAAEMHGQVSPNGRFLAFTSNESGRNEVYVQTFPDPANPRRVSTNGGGYPRWSRGGDELYFRSLDGELLAAPVRLNGTSAAPRAPRRVMRLIDPPAQALHPYDIAADGRILALTQVPGAPTGISLVVLVNWQEALER
jgi:Tol biopolymer transport system component